jgi:hypothetical protein
MHAVGIFLLRSIVANDPSKGDVPTLCLGYFLLCHEGNGLDGCCEASNFLANGFAPNVLVLRVFQQMLIFQEVPSLVVKYR